VVDAPGRASDWTLIVQNGSVTAAGNYPPTGNISRAGA